HPARWTFAKAIFWLLILTVPTAQAKADEIPLVAVSKGKKGFVLDPSGRPFVLWGFDYDYDETRRLIEDYWEEEWPTAEAHSGQMKKLGAKVIQFACSLASSWTPRTSRTPRPWTASANCWTWPSGCGCTST